MSSWVLQSIINELMHLLYSTLCPLATSHQHQVEKPFSLKGQKYGNICSFCVTYVSFNSRNDSQVYFL